jgi:CDP-glucose 4,6-dehydratase
MSVSTDFWHGKRVLVTGHTGFMGGWLVVALKDIGAKVTGYALPPPTTPSFFDTVGLGKLLDHEIRADVRDSAKLSDAFRDQKPDVAFHLAAQPLVREAYRKPADTFDVNVMGTVNLLEAARACANTRSIVVVTTDKVYENLESDWDFRESDRLGGREPYGVSKACAELVAEAYRQSFLAPKNIGVATVRAGNVIGGGDWAAERLIPDIVRAFSAGSTVAVRNPSATRPWQHVLEPLRGCLILAQALYAEPARFSGGWNFGPSREDQKPVSWIVEYCAREWGNNAQWKIETGANSYEAMRLGLTNSKAELRLGWQPLWRIETALGQTLDWYRDMIAGRNMLEQTRAHIRRAFASTPQGLHLKSAE